MENSAGDIIAVDIDLRKITIVSKNCGVLLDRGGFTMAIETIATQLATTTILLEIAGPIMHHDEAYDYRRWLVYNATMSGILASFASIIGKNANVKVATSTKWTCGFGEEERQAIAGIKPIKRSKKKLTYAEPHDIRECRAMIYFYENRPKNWVPLAQYLEEL